MSNPNNELVQASAEAMPGEPPALADDLAIERTILANERTFLAFVRTALGLVIVALALFTVADRSLLAAIGGAMLMLLGVSVAGHGIYRYYCRRVNYLRLRDRESRFIPPRH